MQGEVECIVNPSGGMRSVPGGSWSYFYEEIENQIPRGNNLDPDDPNCLAPCGTQFFCRRYAKQATGSFDDNLSQAFIVCTYPCGGFGFPGNAAHTQVQIGFAGQGTYSETYGTNQICPNAGLSGIFGQVDIASGLTATDTDARCIEDWSSYVLGFAPGIPDGYLPCNYPAQGFVCNPPNVASVTPRQSWNTSTCPFLICEDAACFGPDPTDPSQVVLLAECGCASLFPGQGYGNTAGEYLVTYEEEASSDVTITVLVP